MMELEGWIPFLTIILPFVVASSWLLSRRAFGSLSVIELSPYGLAFWMGLQAQALWGAYLMMWGSRNYIGLERVDGDLPYILTTVAVDYAVLALPLAMILIARAARYDPVSDINRYRAAQILPQESAGDVELFVVLALWTLVSIAIAGVIFSRGSPLLLLLVGNSDIADLARARVALIYLNEWQRILNNIVGGSFTALLVYATYAAALMRAQLRWWVLFAVLLVPSVIVQASSLAKAPVAQLLVGLLLVHVMVRGRLRPRTIGVFVTVVLGALGAAYALAQTDLLLGVDTVGVLGADNPLGRTLIGQLVGVPNYLQIFPGEHPFLMGSELQVLGLFGYQPESAAKIAMEIYLPESVAAQTIGVQNTFFIGAAYANFGWPGVALAPIWVAAVLLIAQRATLALPKTPLGVAIAVWTMYQFVRAIGGGFVSEFTVNTNVVGTLLLALTTWLMVRAVAVIRSSRTATATAVSSPSLVDP